jgi:hypothetical protein
MGLETEVSLPWQRYWEGVRQTGKTLGPTEGLAALERYWTRFFGSVASPNLTIVDLASGDGALFDLYRSVVGGLEGSTYIASDISAAALTHRKQTEKKSVLMCGEYLALKPESVDCLVSQYGWEYTSSDRRFDAFDLVKSEGSIGLVIHVAESQLIKDAGINLDAIGRLTKTRLFNRLSSERQSNALTPPLGTEQEDRAMRELQSSLQEVEVILRVFGDRIAGGFILGIYFELTELIQLMRENPSDSQARAVVLGHEIVSYQRLVETQFRAALSRQERNLLHNQLANRGFRVRQQELFDQPGLIGLAIHATR